MQTEVPSYRDVEATSGFDGAVRLWLRSCIPTDGGDVDRIRSVWPVAKCPIRPGEPCTLCQLDVSGPQDCGLVYLVMNDPELRGGLQRFREAAVHPSDAATSRKAVASG